MHRHACAGSDANRPTPDRHPDACAHTAADGYANAGTAYGHEHAVADGHGHPCATYVNADPAASHRHEHSQADVAACIARTYQSADGYPADAAT